MSGDTILEVHTTEDGRKLVADEEAAACAAAEQRAKEERRALLFVDQHTVRQLLKLPSGYEVRGVVGDDHRCGFVVVVQSDRLKRTPCGSELPRVSAESATDQRGCGCSVERLVFNIPASALEDPNAPRPVRVSAHSRCECGAVPVKAVAEPKGTRGTRLIHLFCSHCFDTEASKIEGAEVHDIEGFDPPPKPRPPYRFRVRPEQPRAPRFDLIFSGTAEDIAKQLAELRDVARVEVDDSQRGIVRLSEDGKTLYLPAMSVGEEVEIGDLKHSEEG